MNAHKILIVDDDLDVINIVSTILKHEGYEVKYTHGKNEGLELARTWNPDLMILDVMMSTHYEGFELARDMYHDALLKNIPVIIQTSIEVFETSINSVAEMAIEYRQDPRYEELQVVLLQDSTKGHVGIDYRTTEGGSTWVPVKAFIKKPVDSSRLLPEIKRLLGSQEEVL